ncbi:hypothetical protein [Stenotrophomonas sp. AG209]|uniref:hypothetical protein n=1 Tax=Stenotrophomonas sp. AG209 TaxID=2183909 RepID=UPI0011C36B77|nr:hypothetical protein [Stenotrophomonas sp. AG209]
MSELHLSSVQPPTDSGIARCSEDLDHHLYLGSLHAGVQQEFRQVPEGVAFDHGVTSMRECTAPSSDPMRGFHDLCAGLAEGAQHFGSQKALCAPRAEQPEAGNEAA